MGSLLRVLWDDFGDHFLSISGSILVVLSDHFLRTYFGHNGPNDNDICLEFLDHFLDDFLHDFLVIFFPVLGTLFGQSWGQI
jgi:hypothetical protein